MCIRDRQIEREAGEGEEQGLEVVQRDEEDEDIRVFVKPADEVFGWLEDGSITNANMLIAVQGLALRRDRLRQEWQR